MDKQVTTRFKTGGEKKLAKPKTSALVKLSIPGRLTKTGWTPPRSLSFKEWCAVGEFFAQMEGAIQWGIGDWWSARDTFEYGERADLFAQGLFGELGFQTLADYGWVARAVETSSRNEVLSFAHHRAVAPLPPAAQRTWLAKAEKNGWPVNELRTAVSTWRRSERHRAIAGAAHAIDSIAGPYPLIYADPPWLHETYSELGKDMISAENHYPTMPLDEIKALTVDGRTIPELAHDDAALYLWCKATNVHHALEVMSAWGFEYKTQAVWDKQRSGTGYVFLNQHEVLLYGSRGAIPAPLSIRSSVFSFPRADHSAKPVEIRDAIAEMYPHFGPEAKIELFCRGDAPGWTTWGFESA